MTARCPAYGCRRRCRGQLDRCTDHQLAVVRDGGSATVHHEVPSSDDPADVARYLIRNTLTAFTAGRITVTEARHTISRALPLAQG